MDTQRQANRRRSIRGAGQSLKDINSTFNATSKSIRVELDSRNMIAPLFAIPQAWRGESHLGHRSRNQDSTPHISRPVVRISCSCNAACIQVRASSSRPPCPYRILLNGDAVEAEGEELKSNVLSQDSGSALSNIQSFMTRKPAKGRELALDRGQSRLASDTARMFRERADNVGGGVLSIHLQGMRYGADRAAG